MNEFFAQTLFTGKIVHYLERTDSTNSFLRRLMNEENIHEGTVVTAEYQTSGRGYTGHAWESEGGKNILMSVLYVPAFLPATDQFLLNQVVCLGIRKAIKVFTGIDSFIKWPNDIYIGDKKLGGILIENTLIAENLSQSIIGIGLNVNQEKFPVELSNAISLKQILHRDTNLTGLFACILENLEASYMDLKQGKVNEIKKEYLSYLYQLNTLHSYEYLGKIIQASIRGISPEGKLILEKEKEILTADFKEIVFL